MMENSNSAALHEVFSVTATEDEGVYILDVALTDLDGRPDRCKYVSREGDTFGLAPVVRQWLVDNEGSYTIEPYVPYIPTVDELREQMKPLSPRQLRLALIREGHSLLSVTAALDSLPAGQAKEEAEIEWEYATEYKRLAPALLTIAQAIGLTPEQVDTMWEKALLI